GQVWLRVGGGDREPRSPEGGGRELVGSFVRVGERREGGGLRCAIQAAVAQSTTQHPALHLVTVAVEQLGQHLEAVTLDRQTAKREEELSPFDAACGRDDRLHIDDAASVV